MEQIKNTWWAYCLREGLGHADISFGVGMMERSAKLSATKERSRGLAIIASMKDKYPAASLALDEIIKRIEAAD